MSPAWCPMSGRRVRANGPVSCTHCGRRVLAMYGVMRKHRLPAEPVSV